MFGNKLLLKDFQCQELSAILKRSNHDSKPGLGKGLPSPFTVSECLFQRVGMSRKEREEFSRCKSVSITIFPSPDTTQD